MTLKSSVYYYYPTTLTETDDTTAKAGIANTSPEYKMLFTNSSTGAEKANAGNTTNMYYWFGLSYVITSTDYAYFGLYSVVPGYVSGNYMYNSNGGVGAPYCGVRPVVYLDSKVQLKDSGTMKDGCKLYNMNVK